MHSLALRDHPSTIFSSISSCPLLVVLNIFETLSGRSAPGWTITSTRSLATHSPMGGVRISVACAVYLALDSDTVSNFTGEGTYAFFGAARRWYALGSTVYIALLVVVSSNLAPVLRYGLTGMLGNGWTSWARYLSLDSDTASNLTGEGTYAFLGPDELRATKGAGPRSAIRADRRET